MNVHDILMSVLLLYVCAVFAYYIRRVRAGNILISLGIIVNAVFLVMRGYVDGAWYLGLMTNELLALPLVLALIVLVLFRKGMKTQGRMVAVALVIFSLAAFLPVPTNPVPSVKDKVFFAPVFFVTETISVAFFITGAFLALAGIIFRVSTDNATRKFILWGFIIFTVSQVFGGIWAYLGWSSPFSWSSRHLCSASTWCLYAALVHAGHAHISPRTHALFAVVGLLPILFIVFHHDLVGLLLAAAGVTP